VHSQRGFRKSAYSSHAASEIKLNAFAIWSKKSMRILNLKETLKISRDSLFKDNLRLYMQKIVKVALMTRAV
jgi:predicted DNA-binding transcriptional regulator